MTLKAFNDPNHPDHAAIIEACLDYANMHERDFSNDDFRQLIVQGHIKVSA